MVEQKAGVVVEEVGIVVEELTSAVEVISNPVVEEEDASISLEDPAGAPVEEGASGLVGSEQVGEEQAENPSTPEIQGALTPKDGNLDPVTDDAAIAIEQQAAGEGSPEVQVDGYKPEEATPVDEQPESQGQNIPVVVEEPEVTSQGPTCVVIETLPEPPSDDVDEARTSTVREELADPVVKSGAVEPQPAPVEEVATVFEGQEDALDRTSVVEENVETVANEAEAQVQAGIEVVQQVAQEPVVGVEVLSFPTVEGKSDTVSEDAVLEVTAPIVEDQAAADDQVKHVLESETFVIEAPSTDEPESASTEESAVPATEEEVAAVGDLVIGGENVSTSDNEPTTVVSEVGGELASTLKAPPSREPIAAIDEAIVVQEQLVPIEPEMTFEVEGGKSSVVEPDVAGPVPEDVPSGEQQVTMDPEAAAQSEEGVVEEGLTVIESDVAVEGDDVVEKIEDEITAVVEDREPTASAVANEGDGHILDAEVVVEPEEGTADLQEGHAEVDPITIDPIEHEGEVVVDEGPTPIESDTVKEAEDEDQVERKVEVEAVVAELSPLVQEAGAVVEPHASEQVEEVEEQSAVNPVSVDVAEVGVVAADKSAESEEQTLPSLETQAESQVEGQLQETLVAQEETAIDELGAVEAKTEHPTLHESIIVEDSLYAAVKEPVIEEQLILVTETLLEESTTANEQSNFNVEEAPITLEHQVEPTAAASEVVEGGSVIELAEPVLEGQSGVDGGRETIELAPVDAVRPTEVDTVEESSVTAPDHSLPAIKDEEQNPKG